MFRLANIGVFLFAAHLGHVQTQSVVPSSTSASPAATHSVNVGAAGLVFTPNSITANVGDTVEFRFYPQNHSVARAEYKYPCIPYEVVDVGKQGFWSGFKPVNVVLSDPPKFSVLINDTEPIFFYCSAPGACEEDIMVGVINPNSSQTLEVQQAFAHNSTVAFSPGENFPAEVASTKSAAPSSSSTTSSPTTATVTTTPTTSATAAASSGSHSPLSTGAIAGIAIGGAAVLILGGALIYLCGRQRTMGELLRHNQQPPPPSYVPNAGHMSMASSAAYTKSPHAEVDSYRFPSQAGYYNGEDESYRSRSPPAEDAMEYTNLGGTASPNRASSPMIRHPVPQSPGRSELTPVTLTDRPVSENAGTGDGVRRSQSQVGPHELGAESNQKYIPYSSPRD
ncbi:hypothetical protein ONS95_007984 [Cadophora gregata]|uniref:uncharacterized protein n=1 Tax=Cadophora gregata TaxID=51156 RepID=UPI0026DD086B|nr:uncharacterized protein ONS95_007984 [Cadophora gregata]KAK0119122.1 hypothetical protein ONS96_012189 [Cadophora gregata f. sp. sojae]KAK0126378.1 hypothetical protein ONS95_007984 [Cadophora gregata]